MARTERISITVQQHAFFCELSGTDDAYQGVEVLIKHHRAVASELRRLREEHTAALRKAQDRDAFRESSDKWHVKTIELGEKMRFWRKISLLSFVAMIVALAALAGQLYF